MGAKITWNNTTITLDITKGEQHKYESKSTDHPVEDGSVISDNQTTELEKCNIKGFLTNIQPEGIIGRQFSLVDELNQAMKQKVLFTVETIAKTYSNMTLESLMMDINEGSGGSVALFLDFKEFRTVTTKETKAPKGSLGKNPNEKDRATSKSNKGKKSTSQANSTQSKSLNKSNKAVPHKSKGTPQAKSWAVQLAGG